MFTPDKVSSERKKLWIVSIPSAFRFTVISQPVTSEYVVELNI
jgi:hypothetical protein